ncbi:hypothetical protein GRI62_05540 [Erythrobacter arachoides]|uniref:Secreted protein n=1 Tax=Aurantiacibacter arachoides TaxID=1850444 RepID=A0A844ZZC2_9SPHN|nr:hypothetical protein [Aurantiacibacter arachoides]MXO93068.1 hypothetical protein [Aurantiacibacter arachoides]GGD52282.1 hypothetical protein GCM10011411_10180 [Aurantiacibacter arachoides]
MPRKSLMAALTASALLLSACGNDVDDGDVEDQAREDAPEEAGVAVDGIASEQVEGIDNPVPVLQNIGDVSVNLGPTLGGCSFEHNGETLFIAGAEDNRNARGNGVIQVSGVDRLLAGADLTGPAGIDAGPTMTDGEYTVTVERGAGQGTAFGVESARWPAELVVRKDMKNEVRYAPGTWTCGV